MLTAILFDLDGTLANTDPLHYQVWQDILRNYGLEIDEIFYQTQISGRTNQEIIRDILPSLSLEAAQQLAEHKEALFRQLGLQLKPLPGLTKMLAWTEELRLKRAVVTNAPAPNAQFMLSVLGLSDTFETVVLAEEAAAGKPDPAPYQLALQRLGVNPESVITFEDSPSGIRSSVGAGIRTIGIASTHKPEKLCSAGAMMAVPDFTDEQLWLWLSSGVGSWTTTKS
ncbi:MAG: HAD-IA family hydrolase [Symploca sp. SIO3C6]|nr:HAD-IA family hydrolase [Symploca sp. SIO3C6]NET05966.1 HAD-IA family hydrolase [Symploca sp. SIO2B6]